MNIKRKRPLYIFDLDGTLANIEHRRHFVSREHHKNWHAFYQACDRDTPIDGVVSTYHSLLEAGCDCVIWSGRQDVVREKTELWLSRQCGINIEYPYLLMRPEGVSTPDAKLKQQWLVDMLEEDRERLVGVFDHRNKVVEMWRKAGLVCFQAAPGDF